MMLHTLQSYMPSGSRRSPYIRLRNNVTPVFCQFWSQDHTFDKFVRDLLDIAIRALGRKVFHTRFRPCVAYICDRSRSIFRPRGII